MTLRPHAARAWAPDGAAGRGADALARLRGYPARAEHLVVGLMTGTSADGVDAVLARFRAGADPELLASRETPLDRALRERVLEAAAAPALEPERVMRLDAALGELYAAATLELLATAGVAPAEVDAIGSHGQTIRHVPRALGGGQAFTWQIGSAAVLAERTGIAVVSDFRSADTAAGGEGAPLVPLADWWLFRSATESRVLLNLGGMANLTWLPAGGSLDEVLAFDTGPGNAVIDALVSLHTDGDERFDRDGARALAGTVSEPLLASLLGDPFFDAPPPRSTGRERFGDAYAARVDAHARRLGLRPEDTIATATELTAASVATAIARFVRPCGRVDVVVASGGGVRNPALMRSLERRLEGTPLRPLETLGVAAGAKEAFAFACLAHRTLMGLPGNVPPATGAHHPAVLGRITPGRLG